MQTAKPDEIRKKDSKEDYFGSVRKNSDAETMELVHESSQLSI